MHISESVDRPGSLVVRPRMNFRPKSTLIVAGLLMVCLHAALLFLVIPHFKGGSAAPVNLQGSPDEYDQLAINLVSGHGYRFYPDTARTAMREPGYPLFLAGIFELFGTGYAAGRVCNLLLAFGTAGMMAPLARRLIPAGASRFPYVYWLPSLLYLVHPGTIVAESRAGVEIPFAFLLVCLMWLICRAVELRNTWYYATAGLVLGVTVLMRSTPILFPLFLLGYLLIRNSAASRARTLVIQVAVMMLTCFAVLSPWIARNFALTGQFIPTADVLGVSAQAGQYINEHLFDGKPFWLLDREAARERDSIALRAGYKFEDGAQGYYQTFYKTSDELAFSHELAHMVTRKYEGHPWLFVRTVGQNLFNFWFAGKVWATTAINAVIQIPYLLFAVVGFRYARRGEGSHVAGILALFIAYMMAVHAPVLAQARYSVPLIPLLSLLSGVGVLTACVQVRSARTMHSAEPAAPATAMHS
ncbi:MAG TPA: glycosyltransferase family 39 protein [Acidobacteriaceae bacterium]|nr:glycosyltransferase family 39 protein [Acidobacteriaceae bacterium]